MSQISWGYISTESENACNRWPRQKKTGNKEWKHSLEVFKMGSHKCKTTAITRDNDLISCRNEHTHQVFPGRSDARLLGQKMKQDTKILQVPVNSIFIANGLQSVSEEKAVRLALPCRSAIDWALNRQKVNERPTLPPIVDRHFEVPKQHEEFCVFDSGIEDPERVLIFGYTYKKLLKRLSAITENTEPHRILLDFERAALNAFASHHTGALLKGCYFHLCQAFNRKINEVGLKRLYETNHDLNLSLRLIPALSFVPVEMVNAAFDLVIEEIKKVSDKFDLDDSITEKLDEVASYFQRTYIKGETIGRNSRDPLFPVNLWNHSEEAAAGLIRTTNAVEGWHLGVASLFKGNHPSVHTFREQIKLDADNQKFNKLKAMGENSNPSRKKYSELNEKVKNICNNFNKDSILTYLYSLAQLSHS